MKKAILVGMMLTACGKSTKDHEDLVQVEKDATFQQLELLFVVPAKDQFATGEKLTFRMNGNQQMNKVDSVKVAYTHYDPAEASKTFSCNAKHLQEDIWETDCKIECVETGDYFISGLTLYAQNNERVQYIVDRNDGRYHFEGSVYGRKSAHTYRPFKIATLEPCLNK